MTSVLAVDDSAAMRQMLASLLRTAGYEVVEAVDGADALEKARSRRVDLVLTDQNMPRMDGLALTRALRAEGQSQPILLLTTEEGEDLRQAARAAGATGWLAKPFDPARLLEVLGRVCNAPARS